MVARCMIASVLLATLMAAAWSPSASACSRATWLGRDGAFDGLNSAIIEYIAGMPWGVDLTKIDFAPGSGIRSVALEGEKAYQLSGDISDELKPSEPIAYLSP